MQDYEDDGQDDEDDLMDDDHICTTGRLPVQQTLEVFYTVVPKVPKG